MTKVILAFVGCLAILLLIFLLCLALYSDIKAARQYRKATPCRGRVRKQLGKTSVNAYGSGLIIMHRRVYCQYQVDFQVNNSIWSGVVQTRAKNLHPGDLVDIRYMINTSTGVPEVISGVYWDRLKELMIGGALGIILAAAIIALKQTELLN